MTLYEVLVDGYSVKEKFDGSLCGSTIIVVDDSEVASYIG